MDIPKEVPVMTLPGATLFPQSLLPLYIFEPRYRRMLSDALRSHRLFIVARQRPRCQREVPEPVSGLGLIRACVAHKDGTSHLVLQGVARVRLERTVRYRPYRIHRVQPLQSPPCDSVAADALMAKVRELAAERIHLGLPLPMGLAGGGEAALSASAEAGRDILEYVQSVEEPDQLADLVTCATLQDSGARQTMLETVDVEARLRRLIQFLLEDIRSKRNRGRHE